MSDDQEPFDVTFGLLVALVVAIGTAVFAGVTGRMSWPSAIVLGACGGLAGAGAATWLVRGPLFGVAVLRRRFSEAPGTVIALFAVSVASLAASRAASGIAAGALVTAGCAIGLLPFLHRR
ncbi:MAG TPA: hypothetical protein VG318_16310 [Actinomycetota bacterium]|nr:hypothetical protein [Actinomycetota bacterium]